MSLALARTVPFPFDTESLIEVSYSSEPRWRHYRLRAYLPPTSLWPSSTQEPHNTGESINLSNLSRSKMVYLCSHYFNSPHNLYPYSWRPRTTLKVYTMMPRAAQAQTMPVRSPCSRCGIEMAGVRRARSQSGEPRRMTCSEPAPWGGMAGSGIRLQTPYLLILTCSVRVVTKYVHMVCLAEIELGNYIDMLWLLNWCYCGIQHAIAYVEGDKYYGAKATINVWEPKIQQANEFSLSQLWILGGSFGEDLNSIEAGWQVLESWVYEFSFCSYLCEVNADHFHGRMQL